MKRLNIICILLSILSIHGFAQERRWEDIDTTGFYQKKITSHGKITLIFINKSPSFDQTTGQRMIDLFFQVYPKEVKLFNPTSSKTVTFVISSEYKGVAATLNNVIKFDPSWLQAHPEDIDCATHELMHVVQDYHGDNPGWLVEGIADYGRNLFGINNENAGWTLPPYRPSQMYTNAYRVTAAFLRWTEAHYRSGLVKKLNTAMRNNAYTDDLWVKLTGKSVDELWYLYSQAG